MDDNHDIELQKERGTNEQYMRMLANADESGRGSVRANTPLPRNSQYLGTVAGGARKGPSVEPFIGRVALSEEDPDLGHSFYIGSGFLNAADIIVIRWVAPMAQLFYKGPDADVDIADSLTARRTFSRLIDDITDFEDALELHAPGAPFTTPTATGSKVDTPPSAAKRPTVAPPPSAAKRPIAAPRPAPPPPAAKPRAGQPPVPTSAPVPTITPSELSIAHPPPEATPAAPVEKAADVGLAAASSPLPDLVKQLRAPKTVLSALTAPRTGRLTSLLRTLQPQQYDLVTWPEDDHLVVQGHPGTGKTVIGLHRAAYLTDPDRLTEGRRAPKGDVLVLGPTHAYVDHVQPVLEELTTGGWAVWSLPRFYSQLGEFADRGFPTDSDHISTSSDPLGIAVIRAVETYTGPRTTVDFVNHLFAAGEKVSAAAGGDSEILSFLRGAKNHEYARDHSRNHPVMALAGLLITGIGLADRFRHIVVDEAQDLRPIDLQILRLLVGHGVNLTILGDMNQRRSDFTHADWDRVAQDLGIAHADGTAPLVPIAVGYRSTNQILRYAAGLLPKAERTAEALRDGPEPRTIRSAKADSMFAEARSEALELQERVGGLVAILTMRPKDLSDHLRKKGWSRGTRQHSWRQAPSGSDVLILHPDNARGLEFDGVVVVEPSEFPARLGRHGVLYTSLTRATKELSVVHHSALLRELKAR